jgi:hypothetical protein
MTPDELAAIERRFALAYDAVEPGRAPLSLAGAVDVLRLTGQSAADVPALIATVRALRAEVATLRREALLRDAGITTTSTGDRA